METLRRYAGVVPAAIAIINAFVALVVAEFFKDDPTAKILLVAAAALLGILAIGATIYNQHRIEATNRAEALARTATRERLGAFLAQGQQLMVQCSDEKGPDPTAAADQWALEAEAYLIQNLGESYVARFRSGAGLPMASTVIFDINRNRLWSGIRVRVARLEQFSAEISP
jgi:hypothetical protein